MTNLKVAILKCTWDDAPWIGDGPVAPRWSAQMIDTVFLPSGNWWGIADFWQDTTFGAIDLAGSRVFPWLKLFAMTAPTSPADYVRDQVFDRAMSQAVGMGWDLSDFTRVLVWVDTTAVQQESGMGGQFNQFPAKVWRGAVLYPDRSHDFLAHEFGHVLGLQHPWGPGVSFSDAKQTKVLYPDAKPYADPYCVMAAQAYNGTNPTFSVGAANPGPPAGDPYWAQLPPMPSAALLHNAVPSFRDGPQSIDLGSLTAQTSREVRLRARDLTAGQGATVAHIRSVTTLQRRQAYWVELRRGAVGTYDRGIVGGATAPAAGVVVHSEQVLMEYPNANLPENLEPKVAYDGVLPLPLAGGGTDYVSVVGDLVVRVDGIAPDLSWVDLRVGGAVLTGAGDLRCEFGTILSTEVATQREGIANGVPIFACGTGTFRYTVRQRDCTLASTAFAGGYRQPVFTWTVNGVPVPPGSGGLDVPASATFPDSPPQEVVRDIRAHLQFTNSGNVLKLVTNHADGNHRLQIGVQAAEGAVLAAPAAPVSMVGVVPVTGLAVRWESRYYDELAQCVNKVRDLNRRFAKSVRWQRIDLQSPVNVVEVLKDLQQRSERLRPRLAGQLDLAGDLGPVIRAFEIAEL